MERGKPGDAGGPKKIYAAPVITGKKNLSQISRDITELSSLSRGDIHNVLTNLVDQLPKYLLEGNSVSLGEFGTLRISFSSEGVERQSEFNTGRIKGVKVIFTPGMAIKNELAKARFKPKK